MTHPIQWVAHYSDGARLTQYDGAVERQYGDIDRARLVAFSLERDGAPVLTVHLTPGQRLIYRRRVFLRPGADGPVVFHLVGWQRTVLGVNVQSIQVYSEATGEIHSIGAWREDHPVFRSVELVPEEAA